MEGGKWRKRGLEAESTSFNRYKRGVKVVERRKRGENGKEGRKEGRKEGKKEVDTRFGVSGWLSVGLNPGAHQQPPTEEELGR